MENLITENTMVFWLVAGAFCIFLEAMAISGIGFLFAGLSALTIGGLLNFGVIGNSHTMLQASLFFAFTAVWAAILWVPLNNFRKKQITGGFKNMVGDAAVVESDSLTKDKTGKVKWSGTIMNAKLDESSEKQVLNKGDEVKIESVEGNLLKVK